MQKFKVDISKNDIIEGQEIILTLQDQQILNGNEINEEDDILENQIIKEKDKLELKRIQMEKLKNKNRMYIDKFEDEKGEKKLLSQYDEDKLHKDGFYIDDQGQIVEDKKKQIDNIINKLKKTQKELDLTYEDKIASDFKPNISKKFQKRNVKVTGKTNLNEFSEIKMESFIETQKLDLPYENDEDQLHRSLEEKMKTAQRLEAKSKAEQKQIKQEEKLKQLIEQNSTIELKQQQKLQQDFQKPIAKKNTNLVEGALEIKTISSTTDFLNSVKTDAEIQESNLRISAPTPFSVKDTREGTVSILNVSLPTERYVGFARRQNTADIQRLEPEKETHLEKEELEEIEKMKDDVLFLEDEKHGVGLASTLKQMRDRGFLNDSNLEYIGRSKDQVIGNSEKDLQLEYRDPEGRLMTQKEAFRYQCWIFHGKGPGRNKQEKRKRKIMQKEHVKSLQPHETPLMKTLLTEQQKNNQCYMVLSSKKQFQ